MNNLRGNERFARARGPATRTRPPNPKSDTGGKGSNRPTHSPARPTAAPLPTPTRRRTTRTPSRHFCSPRVAAQKLLCARVRAALGSERVRAALGSERVRAALGSERRRVRAALARPNPTKARRSSPLPRLACLVSFFLFGAPVARGAGLLFGKTRIVANF